MKTSVIKTFTLLMVALVLMSVPAFSQTEEEGGEESEATSELAKGPKYGTDSVECVKNISLYREYFRMYTRDKNEAYLVDAIPGWRYVFTSCPLATQNVYIDGAVIMKYLIDKETDPARKEKYIDTLMMVYDQRIVYFGREGYVLGRKGADMLKYRGKNIEDIYNTFSRSFELTKDKSEGAVLYYYFITTTNYVRAGKADTALVIEVYDKVSTVAEINIKKGKSKSFQSALDNIENAFTPWATCNDLLRIYQLKFDQTPEDLDLLKKIVSVLERKSCTDNDLYFNAASIIHKKEPTAESANSMGRMSLGRKGFSDAVSYFDQAISLYEDNDKKADASLLQADAYRQINNFSAARNAANRAISLRPNDGRAYLIIGDLYAQSANQCGEDDFTRRTVYWAAVDKFQRARTADPSNTQVVELAASRIAQFSRQFPIKTDIFFQGLSVGGNFTVGCWINETTTIRSSD